MFLSAESGAERSRSLQQHVHKVSGALPHTRQRLAGQLASLHWSALGDWSKLDELEILPRSSVVRAKLVGISKR